MITRLIVIVFLIDTWLLAGVFQPALGLNPLAADWAAADTYSALAVAAGFVALICGITIAIALSVRR